MARGSAVTFLLQLYRAIAFGDNRSNTHPPATRRRATRNYAMPTAIGNEARVRTGVPVKVAPVVPVSCTVR